MNKAARIESRSDANCIWRENTYTLAAVLAGYIYTWLVWAR